MLLQYHRLTLAMKVYFFHTLRFMHIQSCPTLCDPMDCSLLGSSVHGDSPGKNTRVGCHFFCQGIFPTQGLNLYLLHWQADSLPLSHQRNLGYKLQFKKSLCNREGTHTGFGCNRLRLLGPLIVAKAGVQICFTMKSEVANSDVINTMQGA